MSLQITSNAKDIMNVKRTQEEDLLDAKGGMQMEGVISLIGLIHQLKITSKKGDTNNVGEDVSSTELEIKSLNMRINELKKDTEKEHEVENWVLCMVRLGKVCLLFGMWVGCIFCGW